LHVSLDLVFKSLPVSNNTVLGEFLLEIMLSMHDFFFEFHLGFNEVIHQFFIDSVFFFLGTLPGSNHSFVSCFHSWLSIVDDRFTSFKPRSDDVFSICNFLWRWLSLIKLISHRQFGG
jgi:hypothetical protein